MIVFDISLKKKYMTKSMLSRRQIMEMHSSRRQCVFFYLEIKVRILFYHIADELNCRNFYKACVDSYDPEMYLDDSDSDHDFYTDSDED